MRLLFLFLIAGLAFAEEPAPAQADAHLEAAREAIRDRRINDARGHLGKLVLAVDAMPELDTPPRQLLLQADAEIANGNTGAAYGLLRQLASDGEFAIEAFRRLAQLHLMTDQLDRAMPYLQALANRESGRGQVDEIIETLAGDRHTAARIWLRSSQNRAPSSVGSRYLLALVSDDTRALLSELLRDLPDSPSIIDALVRAMPTLDELAALLPDHPENVALRQRTHLELARSRLSADRPAEALAQLDALATMADSESGATLLLRGDVLLAMAKPGQARLIYARYIRHSEAQQASIGTFTRLAHFFLKSNEWDEATLTLELARSTWPEETEFGYLLAEARLGAEDPRAALALIQSSEPTARAFLISARAQAALEQMDVAIQTLQNGRKLHPREMEIAALLAELHIRRGEIDVASKVLGKQEAPILQTLIALHRGQLADATAAHKAISDHDHPLAKLATGRLLLGQARVSADPSLADSADRVLAEADPELAASDRIAAALLAAQLRTPQTPKVAQPPWLLLLILFAALGVLAWWIFRQLDDFSVVEARLEDIEASTRAFICNASPGAEVADIPLVDLVAILQTFDDELAPPAIIEQLESALSCQRVICELRKLPATDRIRFFRIARPIERQLQTVLEELQLTPEALAATRQQETLRV
jgi:hypothetical protein